MSVAPRIVAVHLPPIVDGGGGDADVVQLADHGRGIGRLRRAPPALRDGTHTRRPPGRRRKVCGFRDDSGGVGTKRGVVVAGAGPTWSCGGRRWAGSKIAPAASTAAMRSGASPSSASRAVECSPRSGVGARKPAGRAREIRVGADPQDVAQPGWVQRSSVRFSQSHSLSRASAARSAGAAGHRRRAAPGRSRPAARADSAGDRPGERAVARRGQAPRRRSSSRRVRPSACASPAALADQGDPTVGAEVEPVQGGGADAVALADRRWAAGPRGHHLAGLESGSGR